VPRTAHRPSDSLTWLEAKRDVWVFAGVQQPGRQDCAVPARIAGVEAAGVHGRADGGLPGRVSDQDLAGAQPEGAAHRAEPEQVPGPEGDGASFWIDPVDARVEGVCCHDRSFARRAPAGHRPRAGARIDRGRPAFDFGRCRGGPGRI
jgi:hypothetical protein